MNFKTSLCAILMLVMNAGYSDAPTSLNVIQAETGKVFTVYYKTPVVGDVKISILNKANQVVYSEQVNNIGAFKRPYNFSELQPGEYTIVVEDKNGKQTQTVSYGEKKIQSHIRINQVTESRHKFSVNVMNNGSEKVTVRIYDNGRGLIHEQEIKVTGAYALVYNVEKVRSSAKSVILFEVSTESGKVQTAMF